MNALEKQASSSRGRVAVFLLPLREGEAADGGGLGRQAGLRPIATYGDQAFDAFRDAASGARFDRARGYHVVTLDRLPGVLRRLRDAGFGVVVPEAVQKLLGTQEAASVLDLQAARQRFEVIQAELSKRCGAELSAGVRCGIYCRGKRGHEFQPMRLYDAQRVGVEWLAARRRGLLADGMGVGKSVQTLCSIGAGAPVLVVSPAAMKLGWVTEVQKWRPSLRVTVLRGKQAFRWPGAGEVVVVNAEILPPAHVGGCRGVRIVDCKGCSPIAVGAHKLDCKRGKFPCDGCNKTLGKPLPGTFMAVDEAHAFKNPKTARAQAVRQLRVRVLESGGKAFALTGTPMLNEPDELWNLLDCFDLAHEAFGTRKRFNELMGGREKFIEKYVKGQGRVKKMVGMEWGEPDPDAPSYIQRVCLRRTLEDVRGDMPPKTTRVVPVEIDAQTIAACDSVLAEVGGGARVGELLSRKSIPFQLVSTIRAALATAKMPVMLELVEQHEEADEPLLVFSAYRAPIDALASRPGWATITGDTSAEKRGQIVKDFQEGRLKGVGLTIQAGGVGITLTRAASVVFNDLEWTPALNEQAEARVMRHGQTRPVTVTILVADHQLDRRLTEILTSKKALIAATVERAREGAGDDEQDDGRAVPEEDDREGEGEA